MTNLSFLTTETIQTLFSAAINRLTANGPDFYGWKNDPTIEPDGTITQSVGWGEAATKQTLEPSVAFEIFKAKLNGAYGERFLNTLGMLQALIAKGKRVAILQKAEKGLPFDAEGWIVICVEGYPLFHVAPWDLPMAEIQSIVNVVNEGTPQWDWTEWKGTNKVSEYTMLLNWLAE